MANASLVLTVISADRPGLVETLSETIAAHGASWLESRMAHLAGHFAGLLRVSVPEERAEELAAALRGLDARGLRVIVESAGAEPDAQAPRVRLDLVGLDRPGIVREIASALAARGINVEELESRTSSAPMSGETLFHVNAWLRIPSEPAVEELRTTLEKLADEMMVELVLSGEAER